MSDEWFLLTRCRAMAVDHYVARGRRQALDLMMEKLGLTPDMLHPWEKKYVSNFLERGGEFKAEKVTAHFSRHAGYTIDFVNIIPLAEPPRQ